MNQIDLIPPADPIVEITSAPVMATMMVAWQQKTLALLNHLKSMPAGTEVTHEDNTVLVLEESTLAGFQLGLALAIEELSTLPFVEIPEVGVEMPDTTALPETTVTGS